MGWRVLRISHLRDPGGGRADAARSVCGDGGGGQVVCEQRYVALMVRVLGEWENGWVGLERGVLWWVWAEVLPGRCLNFGASGIDRRSRTHESCCNSFPTFMLPSLSSPNWGFLNRSTRLVNYRLR